MAISIVIAYKGDNGLRTRQMIWTKKRYHKMFPDAEIIISEDKQSRGEGWEGFCKARYINRGVKKAKNDIVLIADIDVVLTKQSINRCIKDLKNHFCIIPYNVIYHLTMKDSMMIMSNEPTEKMPIVTYSRQKKVEVGKDRAQGLCVVRKSTFLEVGGYDERFKGWGSEDSAYLMAMETITGQPVVRHSDIAYHLKHPIVKDRQALRDKNVGLILDEYRRAKGDKEMMLKVIHGRKMP